MSRAMAKASDPPIVEVEWDDAHMAGWWQDGEPEPPEPDLVRSVGYLVHKTRKHLVLIQSRTEGQHGNRIQIPRGMVKSVTVLKQG